MELLAVLSHTCLIGVPRGRGEYKQGLTSGWLTPANVWQSRVCKRRWVSECVFFFSFFFFREPERQIRMSAHQHKALNIYADLQMLTTPIPSVTPITSSASASCRLLLSTSSPLHKYTHQGTSSLFSLVDNEDPAEGNCRNWRFGW